MKKLKVTPSQQLHIILNLLRYRITDFKIKTDENWDIADEDQKIDEHRDITDDEQDLYEHCDIPDEEQSTKANEVIYSVWLQNGESRLAKPMRHLKFLIEYFSKERIKGNKKMHKRGHVEHTENQLRMNWCLLRVELFVLIVKNL